jgi:hypothetical protein
MAENGVNRLAVCFDLDRHFFYHPSSLLESDSRNSAFYPLFDRWAPMVFQIGLTQ